MTTMAVYTTGALPIYIQKMTQWTRDNWNYAGTYTDMKRLIDDAMKKKFSYVLVYAFGVIDSDVLTKLNSLGVKVLAFKDQEKIATELKSARIAEARSVPVKVIEDSDYVEIKIPQKQK